MKNYADVCHNLYAHNPFKDWWAKDPVSEEEEEEEEEEDQSCQDDSSESSNDESHQQTSSSDNQCGGYAKETWKRGCASTKPAPASSSASVEENSHQELEYADPPPSKRRCASDGEKKNIPTSLEDAKRIRSRMAALIRTKSHLSARLAVGPPPSTEVNQTLLYIFRPDETSIKGE